MKATRIIVLALAVLAMCGMASAQITTTSNGTGAATTTLTYSQAETLTVSVNLSTLALTTTAQPIVVTTTWNLAPTRYVVQTQYGLGSATAALASGLNHIPSSAILATGLSSEAPCNQTDSTGGVAVPGVAGAFCQNAFLMGGTPGTPLSNENTSMPSTVYLRLDPTVAATLPYGSYTGTLYFTAWAE